MRAHFREWGDELSRPLSCTDAKFGEGVEGGGSTTVVSVEAEWVGAFDRSNAGRKIVYCGLYGSPERGRFRGGGVAVVERRRAELRSKRDVSPGSRLLSVALLDVHEDRSIE